MVVGMDTLEEAFDARQALVFGIGGSGDIVGAVPTARLLDAHGVATTLGGIAWEPTPRDPRIGPRSLEEIEELERLSDTVGLASARTRTDDGCAFAETHVAAETNERTVLIDISAGVDAMIDGLETACRVLDIDLVIGTDSGGDVLARGNEPGIRSPVTDGLGLVTLEELSVDTVLGVFGYGSDGELTLDELEAGIARAADRDGLLGAWGITPRVRREIESLLGVVDTEASRLPIEAARGDIGQRTIRDGTVSLRLRAPSLVTFYFKPAAVAATSTIAQLVTEHRDLDSIQEALIDRGLTTEFEREAERMQDR